MGVTHAIKTFSRVTFVSSRQRVEQVRAVREGRRRDEDRAAFEFLQCEGRPAVLPWLVRGAVKYYAAGRTLPPCPALREAKQQLLLRSNPLSLHQWLVDVRRYEVTGVASDAVLTKDLRRDFNKGAKDPPEADERAARWDAVVDYVKARGGGVAKRRIGGRPNPGPSRCREETKVNSGPDRLDSPSAP